MGNICVLLEEGEDDDELELDELELDPFFTQFEFYWSYFHFLIVRPIDVFPTVKSISSSDFI